jgi:hypothetical protein
MRTDLVIDRQLRIRPLFEDRLALRNHSADTGAIESQCGAFRCIRNAISGLENPKVTKHVHLLTLTARESKMEIAKDRRQ